jgi:hypothetical protein
MKSVLAGASQLVRFSQHFLGFGHCFFPQCLQNSALAGMLYPQCRQNTSGSRGEPSAPFSSAVVTRGWSLSLPQTIVESILSQTRVTVSAICPPIRHISVPPTRITRNSNAGMYQNSGWPVETRKKAVQPASGRDTARANQKGLLGAPNPVSQIKSTRFKLKKYWQAE